MLEFDGGYYNIIILSIGFKFKMKGDTTKNNEVYRNYFLADLYYFRLRKNIKRLLYNLQICTILNRFMKFHFNSFTCTIHNISCKRFLLVWYN